MNRARVTLRTINILACLSLLVAARGAGAQRPVRITKTVNPTAAAPDSASIKATRALCGEDQAPGDIAIFGAVRDAASNSPLDTAVVLLQWMDLTLARDGVKHLLVSRSALTNGEGRYTACGVPIGATLVAWAVRGGATTGSVFLTLGRLPEHLDFTLDATARRFELDPEPARVRVSDAPPSAIGTAQYRASIRDSNGQPVPGAHARVLGHRYVSATADGALTIDSLAGGTQSLEVLAIGFLPERRVVNVPIGAAPPDTVRLTSLKSVLDTIRVTAGRDETGFDRRRSSKLGQFITAADVERENPVSTTNLLRTRDGLRLQFDMAGDVHIVSTAAADTCTPTILIDGFLQPRAPHVSGVADLNWAMHPDEIGGVEIYNHPALVPIEFQRWMPQANKCGAIVLWTRERLRLPRATFDPASKKP